MRKLTRNILTLVVLIIVMLGITTPVPANAADTSPYGYTYDDSANFRTVYKFYCWSSSKNNYGLAKEFYSKGSYVYTANGVLICNNSKSNGALYNGFDENGNFFIITKDSSVVKIDTTNKVTTLLEKGATHLNYNADELAYSVGTSNGNVYLSNLNPAPETDNDTYTEPVVQKASNRVEIYTNSANELVYEAYKNNKIQTKLVVSSNGSSVLNATAKVRLTDTLKGAKFVGFDTSYNVYLYEKGTLYRFKEGNWYSPQKLALSGNYKSFQKDENGFVTKIVTSQTSYTMKQLTTSSKWKATKTYVVSKSGYKTLYIKGSVTSNTLALSSGVLTLNGKKVSRSVKNYGFVGSKKIIYMKKNGVVYTASLSKPTKAKKLCTKGKSFKCSSVGLVTKVLTSKGSKKVS